MLPVFLSNPPNQHSECIHRGIGLQLINVVFPQNIMSHHWLNVSAPIIDLRIYSYNRLIITPNFFENTMFEELSSLILSNVKIIDENGVQLQLPAASNDATAVNGTKFKFLGICSNIRGTLDARQVQDLLNHDSITAMGNMILEPLENIYIRHDNLKNTIYRATFVNVESGKNVRLPNHYIRYNWPDVFYFVTSDIKAIDLSPNRMWRVTSEHFASLLHKRTQMMLLFDGHPRLCNCSAIPVGFDRPQQRPSKCIEYGGIVSMAEASIPIDEQLSTAVAAKPSNALSLTVATSFEPASKPPTSVGRVEDRLEDELDDEEEPLADQRQETEARSQQDRLRHQRFTNSKSKYDEIFDHDRIENRYKQRFGPLTENYDDSKADPREAIRQDDSNTVEIECVDYDNPRNTETIRVQCRDYLMQITEVDSTTLRVELEESLPNYVLIWFNDSMVTVLDHETTEDDISCMSDVNTTNVIKNLEAGLTYTFCILEKTSITISPFNCAAFYLAHKETSPFWISADKKSLAIGIAVALFVFFTWLGLVFGILLVRRNPTWLKGTKRVVVVNNRDNCPEITSTGSMDLSLEDNNAVENPLSLLCFILIDSGIVILLNFAISSTGTRAYARSLWAVRRASKSAMKWPYIIPTSI